jgi:L-alanine-DL-glutamate epimerase-like enolase superfamily enzyme
VRITNARAWFESLELTRPYTIAFRTIDAVELGFVEIEAGRLRGRGCASPEPFVTGETPGATRAALDGPALEGLVGADVRELPALLRRLESATAETPAARAAVDIALHDLWAQAQDLPLARALGVAHDRLPTSITIGIKGVDETLAEAAEYVERGFWILKIKLGHEVAEDIERIRAVRGRHPGVGLRVDANQGYDASELARFVAATGELGVELIEQPMKASDVAAMRALPADLRARICADEALVTPADALALAAPEPACGIFNIKLMKSGGIAPARRIAAIAETCGIELMWGCMDESRISIAAALHAALSSPATRYLDLDGSLDLARDVATGGFVLEGGMLSLAGGPGLGLD